MSVPSENLIRSGEVALSVSITCDVATHREEIVALWCETGFGATGKNAQARYDWFYQRSPSPTLHLLKQSDSSKVVGCVGIGPREWWVNGECLEAGVLVDFLVAPGHRTLLPAMSLQKQAHKAWLARSPLLYALPNEKATPIFKRLNARITLELVEYVRLVRPRSVLSRVLPSRVAKALSCMVAGVSRVVLALSLRNCDLRASYETHFGAEFTDFWKRLDRRDLAIGTRDAAYLSWRFSQQPGHDYRTLVLRDSANTMRAYFVCEVNQTTFSVRDFLIDGDRTNVTQAFRLLAQVALSCGVESVRVAVTEVPPLVASLHAASFFRRGGRPVFCYISPCSEVRWDRLRWFLTPADEDV